jgi:hypothetical protein
MQRLQCDSKSVGSGLFKINETCCPPVRTLMCRVCVHVNYQVTDEQVVALTAMGQN